MNFSKKRTRVLSALSMAATAALAARSANAVSLSLYYGQDTSLANSNNGVFVSNKYSYSASKNAQGEVSNFGGGISGAVVTPVTVSQTAPTTIVLPVGDYLSLAIDAVLTGNVNPQAGIQKSGDAGPQPTYLGLSVMGLLIASSDLTGTHLTPVSNYGAGAPPATTLEGIPAYGSVALINTVQGANGGTSANAYSVAPNWGAHSGGDVMPNLPGYNTAPNSSGGIGTLANSNSPGAFPAAGNTSGSTGTTAGLSQVEQFASSTNTASYGAATPFADQLGFYGQTRGIVTLTPEVLAGSTSYWSFAGTSSGVHTYRPTHFGSADTIGSLPVLVVNVGPVEPPPPTPFLSFTATAPGANYGGQITNGTGANQGAFNPNTPTPNALNLQATGAHNSYLPAVLTAINGINGASTAYVETTDVVPGDDIDYALDVLVNATQATASQISTLISDIGASGGLQAQATAPNGVLFPTVAGANWNLYIDPQDIGGGTDWLGFNFSNDSNLTGYTVSAVAAVPEPMTLGLFAFSAVGVMARRNRGKTCRS